MENSNKKPFIIISLIIAVVIISLLAFVIIPSAISHTGTDNDKKALRRAENAFSLVRADQKDGTLANGTVIKTNGKFYVCIDNSLTAVQDIPDTSAAVTMATIDGDGTVVYLLDEDGASTAYTPSLGIIYGILIDPDDSSVETYTYSQVNQAAQRFLDEVSYDDVADDLSLISKYVDTSKRYDRPEGLTIELEAGELTVFDNGTKNAYRVTVEKGPYTFYNITPGVGGEFYVQSGDKIIQKGHLRPTGTLRMIYSDTPGLQNMRDLGGWVCDGGTIKYNMLFRGGMVIDANDTDRNTWVKLLGIRHDVFLKTYYDYQFEGKEEYKAKSPLGDNVAFYQKDLSAKDSDNKRNYEQAKEQMNGIINRIFDNAIAGETTYFHCLAGADRTGMVAAVVEGVLGVSKNDIDRDYELTSFNCLRERNSAMYLGDTNIIRSYPGITFRDKCIKYLLDCGISLEKINAFRNAVIDGDPEPITESGLEFDPSGANFCVPNGDGWIDGGRVSSTGADRHDVEGYTLTNYFAVQYGDVVFVKNMHISDTLYSGMYTSDKSPISGFFMSNSKGVGFVKDIGIVNEWEVFTVDHENAGYLRLCGTLKTAKNDVVINISRNGQWLSSDEQQNISSAD